ncbi:MAG TPA: proline iminopeptidase-family hydrolase [Gemmatimonadales bacterium]
MAFETTRRLAGIAAVAATILLGGCSQRDGAALAPGEYTVQMPGGKVWYKIVGGGPGAPLVILHGGPGAPSYYLKPFEALADERAVIFYDQLGAGRSEHTSDTTRWTIPHFVAELDSLRRVLGLWDFHLMGHSWGTMLAAEYAFTHPDSIKSLIFASPALSTARWLADADSLVKTLPRSLQQAIARNEARSTFDAPEYQAAVGAFYERFLSRKLPWSADIDSTFNQLNTDLYGYMWGPSEFTATGTLRDFDATGSLELLQVPALFTTGEFDEALPATVRYYASLMPGSEVAVIAGAAHLTMQDNPEENIRVVREFLYRIDHQKQ